MFCPLCKAEFRDGFAECSDCHIALVATEAQAASVPVDCLWDGDNREECERILTVLTDVGVPYVSKESVSSQPWPWLSFLLWRYMRPRPTCQLKVWVLQSDLKKATEAIRGFVSQGDVAEEQGQ